MAGWSTSSNSSSLDCIEVDNFSALRGNGCSLVKDNVDGADRDKVKQKTLFHQLFSVYLKENCCRGRVRPVPVLLGDGQLLDLYHLFSLVQERGGYAVVSKKGSWDYVTKELGLNLQVLASVKLVYDKYLNEFEGWLRKAIEEKSFENGNHGCDWGFKSSPSDLESEFRSLLCSNLKDKDNDFVQLESKNTIKHIDLVNDQSDANFLDNRNQRNKCKDAQHVDGDDDGDEKICNSVKDDLAASGVEIAGKEFDSRKRKRECETLSGMLKWVKHTATHPLDPVAQPIPKPSKWKEIKGQGFFVQVVRARDVRLQKQHADPNGGSSSQKLKMHPAMYEDDVAPGHHGTVKLRCSERLPLAARSRCTCGKSCYANGNRLPSSVKMEVEKCPPEKTTAKLDKKIISDTAGDDFLGKRVSIGPRFQAEVPEWTGVVSKDDSKWFGTEVWRPKHDSEPATETDHNGRGRRQERCSCYLPGSVECVRFHIAENRMKLKLQLGSAFYHWGFDQMGEEVSLRWTPDEEKKFKDVMRSKDPSQIKFFWNNPSKYFRNKTRKDLVSYYFNVFLIQRRIYQNRVTPKSVDSDDDEAEFGSFGDGFGMQAVKGPAIDFLQCSENKECTDLE